MFIAKPNGEVEEMEWCQEHFEYDGCVKKCGCRGTCVVHKDEQIYSRDEARYTSLNSRVKSGTLIQFPQHTGNGHTWTRPLLPGVTPPASQLKFVCRCECHKRPVRPEVTCKEWCCRQKIYTEPIKPCLCLCHFLKSVACDGTITCCPEQCGYGETDAEPSEIMSAEKFPFNATILTRRRNKDKMTRKPHLHMTVEGAPEAVDLFHILLYEVDQDYPRDPLAKPGTMIPMCKKCKGLVWDRMILSPAELKKLAKDTTEVAGTEVKVKVHSWSDRCKGEVEMVAL